MERITRSKHVDANCRTTFGVALIWIVAMAFHGLIDYWAGEYPHHDGLRIFTIILGIGLFFLAITGVIHTFWGLQVLPTADIEDSTVYGGLLMIVLMFGVVLGDMVYWHVPTKWNGYVVRIMFTVVCLYTAFVGYLGRRCWVEEERRRADAERKKNDNNPGSVLTGMDEMDDLMAKDAWV